MWIIFKFSWTHHWPRLYCCSHLPCVFAQAVRPSLLSLLLLRCLFSSRGERTEISMEKAVIGSSCVCAWDCPDGRTAVAFKTLSWRIGCTLEFCKILLGHCWDIVWPWWFPGRMSHLRCCSIWSDCRNPALLFFLILLVLGNSVCLLSQLQAGVSALVFHPNVICRHFDLY